MNNEVIVAENLTKRFGDFTAVNAVNFSVHTGEIFGFLGANGAGKTTAMRMLCGLSVPTSGSATVAGFSVYDNPEKIKENIGYMSQKFSLYEDLTVVENIRFFGGIYGIDSKELSAKMAHLIRLLGLEKNQHTLVGAFAAGMEAKTGFFCRGHS